MYVTPPSTAPAWILMALKGNRLQPAWHLLPAFTQQLNQILGHIPILLIEKWSG